MGDFAWEMPTIGRVEDVMGNVEGFGPGLFSAESYSTTNFLAILIVTILVFIVFFITCTDLPWMGAARNFLGLKKINLF